MWLTALAGALPALAKVAQDVIGHDDNAKKAASVVADPNAPQAVKDAAAAVAQKSIDESAKAQKATVAAMAGKPQSDSSSSSTTLLLAVALGVLVLGRRRR